MAGFTAEQAYGIEPTENKTNKALDIHGTRAERISYTPELGEEICRLIASGRSLQWICSQRGFPSQWCVYQWLRNPKYAEFSAAYRAAREDQVDTLVDQIIDIADDSTNDFVETARGGYRLDDEHVRRSQIRIDARKWIAERMQPRKYGPSSELRLKDPDGVVKPVQINIVAAEPPTIEHDPNEHRAEPGEPDLFEPGEEEPAPKQLFNPFARSSFEPGDPSFEPEEGA